MMPTEIKNQDIVKLFEFVIQEIDRLAELRRNDWKKASEEIGLNRGLPCNYDDFCGDFRECGKVAAQKLYEMAAAKLRSNPKLSGRVLTETFLKPIEVELAQKGVVERKKIDQALVTAIMREAESRTCAKLEDRTYFLPVFTIAVENAQEYSFGPVKFVRNQKFFADNEAGLKSSEEATARSLHKSATPKETDDYKTHISNLFKIARDHYASYRWIACIDIREAEPEVGWQKSREIVEQTFGLLRLASRSRSGQFIGLIEENPTPRSASYLSFKQTKEFEVSSSSSYGEPNVIPEFIEDYRRKVPQLGNLEAIILKTQKWEKTDSIEDRLLSALFWFNEAWKETILLPKIVKFCTCVESLFSTGNDHEAISEKISERLAWLSFPGAEDWQERRTTYVTMKKVYGARSKAVHGDSAANDLDLPLRAYQSEEQATLGIFAFSQLPPLFRDKKDKEQLLNEFFVRLKLEGLQRARHLFDA
jgi:hypothetical protein